MQSINSGKLTDWPVFWWPHPDAFNDLTVEDVESGFELSAPDDTECGEWLAYWDQDEAHHEVFQTEFIRCLTDHANKTLETHGENQSIPVGSPCDSEQAQDVSAGSLT